MPKKTASNDGAKAVQARVKRAEAVIEEVLKRENVMLTANRVRVMFANAEGKYRGGSVLDVKDFAELVGRPNMLLMPQVQLEAKQAPPEPTKPK